MIQNKTMILTMIIMVIPTIGQAGNESTLSPLVISPAQSHLFEETQFDSQYTYGTTKLIEDTLNSQSMSREEILHNKFEAKAVHNLQALPATLGLKAEFDDVKTNPEGQLETSTETLAITPSISLEATESICFGAEIGLYNSQQETVLSDNETTSETSYTLPAVGATYHNEVLEAGVLYSKEVNDNQTKVPAKVRLHGTYQVSPIVKVGGFLDQVNYAAVDENSKDIVQTTILTQVSPLNRISIQGMYRYKPAHNKSKNAISAKTLSSQMVLLGGDYAIKPNIKLGGFLSDQFAEEKSSASQFENEQLTIGLRAGLTL